MSNVVQIRDYQPRPLKPRSWDDLTLEAIEFWFGPFLPLPDCQIYILPQADTAPCEMNPDQDSA